MTILEQAIDAIEHGLVAVTRNGDGPEKKMELPQRMAYYKVPGFSAAFIHHEGFA